MSRCLAERSIDHVVIERGEVANSWRTERWDSLRLLTPNWQSRLPGYGYDGDDPDGYRTMPEVIDVPRPLRRHDFGAGPDATTVTSVSATDDGFRCRNRQGDLELPNASCSRPAPAISREFRRRRGGFRRRSPPSRSMNYRNPGQLDEGGVLVVGASATGTQLADEIHRSGRPVTLAVGEHVRAPRVYRGKDIQWWMDVDRPARRAL